MTRVFEQNQPHGGTRVLILGSAAYRHAKEAGPRSPKLNAISSASKSALDLASRILGPWRGRLAKPLATIDLLIDSVEQPDGVTFLDSQGSPHRLSAPTIANIEQACQQWTQGAQERDVLVLYCCGHGLYLPSGGPTFLAADFGLNEQAPWGSAIAIDDFVYGLSAEAPREQWLIFDCCNDLTDDPPANGHGRPIFEAAFGDVRAADTAFGDLTVIVFRPPPIGQQAFGKNNRASRFMEAFLEACDRSGCRFSHNGRWWSDSTGITEAIVTYHLRVASIEEMTYFTFKTVTTTQQVNLPPRLLGFSERPEATLIVRSDPTHLLPQCSLVIRCDGLHVDEQSPGAAAVATFRRPVPAYRDYDLTVSLGKWTETQTTFAHPPKAEVEFRSPATPIAD